MAASLRALVTFHADGRTVADGDVLPASDPIVKGREHLFEPDTGDGVEQATAAPGEKRTRTRRPAAKRQG